MITLVAAVAANGCIGKDGNLAWRNKEDMAHFVELTIGKTVLMGRKTWESIPEKFRPLPNRINVVITRNKGYALPDNVMSCQSVDAAFKRLRLTNIMVIGGAEIYAATIDKADCLELTEIETSIDGNVFFPTIDKSIWKETARINKEGFAFVTYHKRSYAHCC